MSYSIEIDSSNAEAKLTRLTRALQNLPLALVKDAAEIIEDQMRQEIPISSGKLQSSVSTTITGTTAEVGTHTGYGAAVDKGRRGFHIEGRPFLRFFINGKIVFARSANPGPAKANNFRNRTILNSGSRILAMLDLTLERELSKV